MQSDYHVENPYIIPSLLTVSLAIFAVDCVTPLGTGDYILYFVPVALTIFGRRPFLAPQIALFTTILSVVGFFVSPMSNANYERAILNRIIAMVTVWAVSFMAKKIIEINNQAADTNWLKDGQTQLSLLINGELDRMELAEKVLGFLNSYTGMRMGAFYERKIKENKINYVMGYALPHDFKQNSIAFGEGLLGQACIEKKMIELKEIPENFYRLTTAIGEAPPTNIFIIPFTVDGKVLGVVESSYLKEPPPLIRELLKEITEPMAVAMRSVQYKETLSDLLSESQQLSEELQAQQEELRVSNEELEQQSKALRDSYARMENQQSELEQTNQQLEEQAQTLEHQKELLNERNKDLLSSQLALLEKSKEVERASRYKSEFLANMSHELRTPLNSTLILAKILADNKQGNLTEEQVKQAEVIHASGNDLLNLINDILDLTKIEAGRLAVNLDDIHVPDMLSGLERMFHPIAQERRIQFEVVVSEKLPPTFRSDRIRIEQILKNFLSNAFKFTEKGSIKLIASSEGDNLSFEVKDTGIGIPQEQQGIIFEAFRQADGTINRKYGGTGLGLSISRELSTLLDGTITVQSTPGEGSSFILTLPPKLNSEKKNLNASYVEPSIKKAKENFRQEKIEFRPSFKDDRDEVTPDSRKILIIEDDETFAKILLDLAHEMGFKGLVALMAETGIEMIEKYSPQAVILDVRLPDYNGLMILDQLKMNPKTRHIPVHVISADDFSRNALEMGAMGHMLKPVKREKLKEAFTQLSSIMADKVKHVLIVEDDKVQKDHILKLLSDPGIEIDAVLTATEALDHLAKRTYDCMIMDLSLPDLSGHELLAELARKNSPYSYPPVIVYTARDLLPEEEEKLRHYSESIIIKGARSPERLLNEVTLFLHRVETELPPERQKMLKDLRSRDKTLEGKKILVVDDDVRNIFALTSALENHGAQVLVARNGKEALEKLNSEVGVDTVLMDIMMPEMDGHEAMRNIRKQARFADLPIIALTAKAMKDDQEKCLAAGANDYLAKPINIDKLISLLRVWLQSKGSFIS